jgi:hypothetical protein
MNKMAGQITKQGSDPSGLGRWTYSCLEGKPLGDGSKSTPRHRKINIISAYLVSQNDSSSTGHDTAFMQQKCLLTLKGESNPKPRKQGFLDLTKQIQSMQDKDNDVLLLCTDANVGILDPDFQEMIGKPGLMDLMAHKLGPDLPETYIREIKMVDIAYGSP